MARRNLVAQQLLPVPEAEGATLARAGFGRGVEAHDMLSEMFGGGEPGGALLTGEERCSMFLEVSGQVLLPLVGLLALGAAPWMGLLVLVHVLRVPNVKEMGRLHH